MSTSTLRLVDRQIRVVDARLVVVDVIEDHRVPAVVHERIGGRGGLEDRALGGEIAAQHRDAALFLEGLCEGMDHIAVPARGLFHVLPEGASAGGDHVAVEHPGLGELPVHRRQAARVEEVLHQVLAGRHEVHDARDVTAQGVPVVEGEADADAPGEREEVHDRVGGAADRPVGADGVLECLVP